MSTSILLLHLNALLFWNLVALTEDESVILLFLNFPEYGLVEAEPRTSSHDVTIRQVRQTHFP